MLFRSWVATTNELMQNTNPYYRSGYVIVHRPELQLTEGRLDDPVFKALRVGMRPRTPVATLVARYGLLDRARDRKSVVSGKRVSVSVDLGGRRIIKKKKKQQKNP